MAAPVLHSYRILCFLAQRLQWLVAEEARAVDANNIPQSMYYSIMKVYFLQSITTDIEWPMTLEKYYKIYISFSYIILSL